MTADHPPASNIPWARPDGLCPPYAALLADGGCQTELARSAALRQSILKDAFAGKLVPQDPSDEPAAELLARIRATRPAPARRVGKAQRAHAEQTTNDR
jgi:hypothetical protein